MPIPMRHLNERVDAALSAIIMTALAPDPGNRHVSAAAMQEELEGYLAQPAQDDYDLAFPEFWVLGFTQAPDGLQGSMRVVAQSTVVGRSSKADVILPDESVSSRHARLRPRGLYLEVEDLGTIGGTKIDGNFINQRTLCRQGATIDFGNVRARVGRK